MVLLALAIDHKPDVPRTDQASHSLRVIPARVGIPGEINVGYPAARKIRCLTGTALCCFMVVLVCCSPNY
jgi:hypothetical protein